MVRIQSRKSSRRFFNRRGCIRNDVDTLEMMNVDLESIVRDSCLRDPARSAHLAEILIMAACRSFISSPLWTP